MDQPSPVRGGQASRRSDEHGQDLLPRVVGPPEPALQGRAGDVLHRQVVLSVGLAEAEDGADGWAVGVSSCGIAKPLSSFGSTATAPVRGTETST